MIYSFDDFRLNTDTGQLIRGEAAIALEPRAFGLLVLLIQHRHRIVTKDDVVEHLWKGRFTSDAAIATCVKSLRKALQDDASQQRYIHTLRGRGFRFVASITEWASVAATPAPTQPAPTAPDTLSLLQGKPSLIVLPFHSLLLDGDHSVMTEGMAHELIQSLARLRWLRVIARGTAFQFSPLSDLREVGRQVSVRYALSGTLEKQPQGLAVTVELSNCESADILWADRYPFRSDALHDIRQTIIANVISALEIYIPQQEATQAALQSTENMDAWAHYHLGLRHVFRFTRDDNARANVHFTQAIKLDPRFARAWGGLSFTRFQDAFVRYDTDIQAAIQDARTFAQTSVDLDPLDPFTNYNMGRSFWLEGDTQGGFSWLERSVILSPSFAHGHYSCAFAEVMQGNPSAAIWDAEKALCTSPLDPLLYAIFGVISFGKLMEADLVNALHYADKAARAPGAHFLIHMIAAVTYALAGEKDAAKYWHDRARKLNPRADANHFFAAFPFTDTVFRDTLMKGLKLAGF